MYRQLNYSLANILTVAECTDTEAAIKSTDIKDNLPDPLAKRQFNIRFSYTQYIISIQMYIYIYIYVITFICALICAQFISFLATPAAATHVPFGIC